jgi:hypothetical protein
MQTNYPQYYIVSKTDGLRAASRGYGVQPPTNNHSRKKKENKNIIIMYTPTRQLFVFNSERLTATLNQFILVFRVIFCASFILLVGRGIRGTSNGARAALSLDPGRAQI